MYMAVNQRRQDGAMRKISDQGWIREIITVKMGDVENGTTL